MILALEADINSLYGKSHLGLSQTDEAITRHKLEFQVAKQTGNVDLKYRAMDNLAVSKTFGEFLVNDRTESLSCSFLAYRG